VVLWCAWQDHLQCHYSHHYLCPVYLTEVPPESAISVVELWLSCSCYPVANLIDGHTLIMLLPPMRILLRNQHSVVSWFLNQGFKCVSPWKNVDWLADIMSMITPTTSVLRTGQVTDNLHYLN
jgi:hypothetical protein